MGRRRPYPAQSGQGGTVTRDLPRLLTCITMDASQPGLRPELPRFGRDEFECVGVDASHLCARQVGRVRLHPRANLSVRPGLSAGSVSQGSTWTVPVVPLLGRRYGGRAPGTSPVRGWIFPLTFPVAVNGSSKWTTQAGGGVLTGYPHQEIARAERPASHADSKSYPPLTAIRAPIRSITRFILHEDPFNVLICRDPLVTN
jgi:hypothetical protein